MRAVRLTINGSPVEAEVEPRRSLADFLREDQFLTGTHIGCEHGVCGACTILIDGTPARSCITYAVACDGADITTIEGLERDAVMASLREAFSQHHALQCGYCTPGMLISARDIVRRLPQADEKRIRLELSGNLCRCTGYVGIVAAVGAVLAERKQTAALPAVTRRGPVGAHPPTLADATSPRVKTAARQASVSHRSENLRQEDWSAVERNGVELLQSFEVPCAREETWRLLANLETVAHCIPGARLAAAPQHGRAEGEMLVKLGPIVSAFSGLVEIERDDAAFRGVVRAAGRDAKSGSNARSIIVYTVKSLNESSSQVDISVKFLLTGTLAQFSRSGLIKDVADQLTRAFARNLAGRLSGTTDTQSDQHVLDAGKLARAAIWHRIVRFCRRLLRPGQ
jgi:aerobic carbon-monoxide dehydrogenase small subunit